MTELKLYKFITDRGLETSSYENIRNEKVYLLFVNNAHIVEFHKLLSPSIFDDDGIECKMKDGYFAFDIGYICEYYDVDIEEVFKGLRE